MHTTQFLDYQLQGIQIMSAQKGSKRRWAWRVLIFAKFTRLPR